MNYIERFEILKNQSIKKILKIVENSEDIYFFKAWGNVGDSLIYEGTKELLSNIKYTEVDLQRFSNETGNIDLVSG